MADDDLFAAVVEKADEIAEPIRQAEANAGRINTFRDTFPEEAAELDRLKAQNVDASAREFARGYERFNGTTKGFAAVALTSIADSHKKISERTFGHADLEALLTTFTAGGVVDYGEQGSSRGGNTDNATAGVQPTGNTREDRQAFANIVKTRMTEDKLDRTTALALVSQDNPELAVAYQSGHAK
jgi:hypothetical protein